MKTNQLHSESSLSNQLLEILACPACKGELIYNKAHQELICQFDRLAYPIVDGIPVMLESRSRRLTES